MSTAPGAPADDIAVFDLDRTLGGSVALLLLSRGVGASQRTRNAVGMIVDRATRPVRRWAGLEETTTLEALFQVLAGRQVEAVRKAARTVATTEILPRVHPQVARIIAANNAVGYATALVTTAPEELARAVADTLDVEYVVATRSEVDARGRLTGRPDGELNTGPVKLTRVQALLDKLGLDLSQAHVYSDASGSRELLEAAGFKHVVNPDGALRQRALDEGWAVHDVRPVGWLWAAELPGAATIGAAGAGLVAGWILRGHRDQR